MTKGRSTNDGQLVTVNGTERRITPETIGSFIIRTLHPTAESKLSMPVKSVVMSVPAEFDGMQRNRTKLAATLAGRLDRSSWAIQCALCLCVVRCRLFVGFNTVILLYCKC